MHYVPYGKYAGIAVSAVSILCFVLLMRRYAGKRKEPEKECRKRKQK
jgi:uncharacterized membrane protein YfhO